MIKNTKIKISPEPSPLGKVDFCEAKRRMRSWHTIKFLPKYWTALTNRILCPIFPQGEGKFYDNKRKILQKPLANFKIYGIIDLLCAS